MVVQGIKGRRAAGQKPSDRPLQSNSNMEGQLHQGCKKVCREWKGKLKHRGIFTPLYENLALFSLHSKTKTSGHGLQQKQNLIRSESLSKSF